MKSSFFNRWIPRFQAVPEGPVWGAFWIVSVAAAIFGLSMEWVFFATKPSFMSVLTGWERAQILMLSPLPLIAVSAAVSILLGVAGRLVSRARGALVRIGMLGPGLILASSFLLLLDNFTYTLFRIGIQTATGFWRYGYLAVFGGFWWWGWRIGMGVLRGLLARGNPKRLVLGLAGLGIVAGGIGLVVGRSPEGEPAEGAEAGHENAMPNILLLTPDGVSAENLSVYGYERDTTPFVRAHAEGQALICENGFANATTSGGSIASLLTGKLPTTTRLYYPPEILMGPAAYEHLPGILRKYGYENVDISCRQNADAFDLNMLNSFHEANGRLESSSRWRLVAGKWLGMHTAYFLESSWERLRDRVLHAAGVKDFESSYDEVVDKQELTLEHDGERLDRLLRLIRADRRRPFFAHVHFLWTHGPSFYSPNPVFSKKGQQQEPFERDFYDDAILDLDGVLGKITAALAAARQLDRTVIVLSSDHGRRWGSGRIPLIFWFPGGAHAGRIRTNAQNLDVAPTLLAYLGIPQPEWMEGLSLLAGEPPADRPVFNTTANSGVVDFTTGLVDSSRTKPPFYSLGRLTATIGNRTFALDLNTGNVATGVVEGHTQPVGEGQGPSLAEAREFLFRHLEKSGYKLPASWRTAGGESPAKGTR